MRTDLLSQKEIISIRAKHLSELSQNLERAIARDHNQPINFTEVRQNLKSHATALLDALDEIISFPRAE